MATGEWVRPVSRTNDKAIPYLATVIEGQKLRLLDVVEARLSAERPFDRYQRENRFAEDWSWKIVGRVEVEDVLKYCEGNEIILHNDADHVDASALDALDKKRWKSLQLVRVQDAVFERDRYKNTRWRVTFTDGSGNELRLKLTDPVAHNKLARKVKIGPKCLLTISLAGPWRPTPVVPKRCYKLVAGVIEL